MVRISTGKAIQSRGSGHSLNRRTLKTEKLLSSSHSRKSALMSGFPEKGGWGTSGEVWETSGEPLVAGRFHSGRTSGEVAEKLPGKFGELPGISQKLGGA